jgi:hypothetical protein
MPLFFFFEYNRTFIQCHFDYSLVFHLLYAAVSIVKKLVHDIQDILLLLSITHTTICYHTFVHIHSYHLPTYTTIYHHASHQDTATPANHHNHAPLYYLLRTHSHYHCSTHSQRRHHFTSHPNQRIRTHKPTNMAAQRNHIAHMLRRHCRGRVHMALGLWIFGVE